MKTQKFVIVFKWVVTLNRRDHLMDLSLSPNHILPNGPVVLPAAPKKFRTIDPGILEEIANIHTDQQTTKKWHEECDVYNSGRSDLVTESYNLLTKILLL